MSESTGARDTRVFYESVIKVNRTDEPWKRGRDIADGISYACALLMDEYEWTAQGIAELLERVTDDVTDQEEDRRANA